MVGYCSKEVGVSSKLVGEGITPLKIIPHSHLPARDNRRSAYPVTNGLLGLAIYQSMVGPVRSGVVPYLSRPYVSLRILPTACWRSGSAMHSVSLMSLIEWLGIPNSYSS